MIAAAHRHLDGRDYRLVDPDYKSGKETHWSIATWQLCEDYFGLERTAEEQRDWMIVDPARPWSPIDAGVSAGIGWLSWSRTPGTLEMKFSVLAFSAAASAPAASSALRWKLTGTTEAPPSTPARWASTVSHELWA